MKKDFSTILKENKYKSTKARLAILNVFSLECHPMTAEEIHKKLPSKKIDLATVYRSLKSFEESGIIEKINLQKDSVYYELPSHHHHVVCKKCGLIEELKDCDSEDMVQKIQKTSKNFKRITSHSLEFFGLCQKCDLKCTRLCNLIVFPTLVLVQCWCFCLLFKI